MTWRFIIIIIMNSSIRSNNNNNNNNNDDDNFNDDTPRVSYSVQRIHMRDYDRIRVFSEEASRPFL